MKVGIVDYDAGNLRSVETALRVLKFTYVTSSRPEDLAGCDILIVPGVGEAASAMRSLERNGLDKTIKSHAKGGKRLIGICLGFQIFLTHSEERNTDCLDLIRGQVKRFPKSAGIKVPHMGWNQVDYVQRKTGENPLVFEGIPEGRSFYFVHSYYADTDSTDSVIGITDYSARFVSVVQRDNVVAFQFHPEKSGPYGLRLLENAIRAGKGEGNA